MMYGFDELEKMLGQLAKSMSKTVMKNALKKAAVPIRDEAIQNAPGGPTGNLKKGIKISTQLTRRQRRYRKLGEAEVFVGTAPPAYHGHLVEFGTIEREWKSGKSTGRMTGKPFLRPAWDAKKGAALKILQIEVWRELEKAARRLRGKAEKGTLGKGAVRALRG
jgi:HK97 gp10 family phage protein